MEGQNFADALASIWVEGEMLHLTNLILHDAGADVRAPTHELTIARDVLRTRRRIASQPPAWALMRGICRLCWRRLSRSMPGMNCPCPARALAWPVVCRLDPAAGRHRDRETRMLAIAHRLLAAAEIGMKEHHRLVLARTLMERKLEVCRTSSKLPELVELLMGRPIVHTEW